METIYYHLDARRLSVCADGAQRASGGGDTVCYAFVHKKPTAQKQMGQVLDFNAWRSAHAPAESDAPIPEVPHAPVPAPKTGGLALLLDVLATAAVVVVVAVVVLRFLAL